MRRRAAIGAPVMVSVSAPTALAVRMADAAGITLVAIAGADGFEVFMHPRRISDRAAAAMTTADGPEVQEGL
jgi:FdhD protein